MPSEQVQEASRSQGPKLLTPPEEICSHQKVKTSALWQQPVNVVRSSQDHRLCAGFILGLKRREQILACCSSIYQNTRDSHTAEFLGKGLRNVLEATPANHRLSVQCAQYNKNRTSRTSRLIAERFCSTWYSIGLIEVEWSKDSRTSVWTHSLDFIHSHAVEIARIILVAFLVSRRKPF